MFSRFAVRALKPAGMSTRGPAPRFVLQARFMSQQAPDGSKGRSMPAPRTRATAPVTNQSAILTIRVGEHCSKPLYNLTIMANSWLSRTDPSFMVLLLAQTPTSRARLSLQRRWSVIPSP